MDERIYKMDKLKEEGKSYREIAKYFGISYQRVSQLLGKQDKRYFKNIKESVVAYKGIRDWLNKNKICFSEFCRMIYGYYHPALYTRTSNYLNKKCVIRIDLIKKILNITNLTFEEAFNED